ncbi:response regulator [Alsobacter sp. KACC 23698]|uniref:histidine kinase n=1 Tax=Alsobacter sp. KACC 23698 TaxID=3149229 RepID=A0AAU7JNS0_9HYPH
MNILLVDDQPSKILSHEVILAELGENLITATSPREVFEHLLRSEVAVVLMDVQMPELDGFELAAMIREHPRYEKIAIIFVSAIHLTDLDRLRGYAAGAVDYVPVPVVPEVLRAKVRVFVDLYRKTRQLERMNEELERRVAERTAELEASTRRLTESEQRRSLAMAAGSMGSWDWNVATGDYAWDAGQYRIYGVDPAQFRPTRETVAALVHPDDRAAVRRATGDALRSGRTSRAEFRIVRPDRQVRWCITSGATTFDADGRPVRMSGVTYDITERKLAEEALERLNEELERRIEERTREREMALAQLFEAQKMDTIGQLTGGVAHDFNNLLMAVLGSLELLRKRVVDERSLRLLDNASEGAKRGAALTKRLLAFARRQELKPEVVDVAALVCGIEDLLRRALGPSVRLTTDFPDGLPAIQADVNQLELALLNLAVNARDAMPDGGLLSISATVVDAARTGFDRLRPGEYLCIAVADTGSGMDAATLAKAAEPFFTTKGPGKGTGLGLSMVHGMAGQSGGALHLVSEPGEGTTVRIYLPLAAPELAVAEPAPAPGPSFRPDLPRLTILVVDDDELVRTGAVAMLEDMGHHVVEAASGGQALSALEARGGAVDLVVTDHAMPGMTGAELVRVLGERYPGLPTILASGYAETPVGAGAIADVRLAKPFTQDEIASAMERAIAAGSRLAQG